MEGYIFIWIDIRKENSGAIHEDNFTDCIIY